MGVLDGVNVRVGVIGVAVGIGVRVEGLKGVADGGKVAVSVGDDDAVGVNGKVAVSRLGVGEGPVVVAGMISVSVGEAVSVVVGVAVLDPGGGN
jgi:hypothetical protein